MKSGVPAGTGVLLKLSLAAPLFFYVFMGKLLQVSNGEYRLSYLILFALPWAAALCFQVPDRAASFPLAPTVEIGITRFAAFGLFYGMGELALRSSVNFSEWPAALRWISWALDLAWFCSGGLLVLLWRPARQSEARYPSALFWGLCSIFAICLGGAMLLTVAGSPHPHIDVFTVLTAAADFGLSGLNPYSQKYSVTYQSQYTNPTANVYWPGVLYAVTAAKGLFGDVRYAFVAANLITAYLLSRLAGELRMPRAMRGLLPLLWLGYPISLHVVEMAWVDPLLVASCAWAALELIGKRWLRAGIALGVCCAVRQYSVFFVLLAFVSVYRQHGIRVLARVGALCSMIFALLILPSVVSDFGSFYACTIKTLFDYQVRKDALSIPSALLNLWGYQLGNSVMSASYVVALALSMIWVVRRKGSAQAWAASLVLVYGAVFLMGKQAFCNYYYLLSFYSLLAWISRWELGNRQGSQVVE